MDRRRLLCDECAEKLSRMGMDWHLDLRTDPERDRKNASHRRFVPMWRQRATAKDLTAA